HPTMKGKHRLFILGIYMVCTPLLSQEIRTRSLASKAHDIPRLAIGGLVPNTAEDLTYLSVITADTVDLQIFIHPWMSGFRVYREIFLRVSPGDQRVPIYLYEMRQGDYCLRILRNDEILAVRMLKIER
ncbi:MAG: hypothetical protein AAFP00_17215, partial [Bacteroidota bacterium]